MIETERLVIRLAETADVQEVVRFYRENRAHMEPFSPTYSADFVDQATWLEQVGRAS